MIIPVIIFLVFLVIFIITRMAMEKLSTRLLSSGMRAKAKIIKTEPQVGNFFEYEVDGKTYQRSYIARRVPAVGSTIDIMYDFLDPETACPADPEFLEVYRGRSNLYIVASIAAVVVSVIIGVAKGTFFF